MRVLDLSGHYGRRVEIDTCPHCCLVWFDDTESVRLAGPGIAELLREIHGAVQAGGKHAHAVSLARVQSCPVCAGPLKTVANRTRFGRTTHLECALGHGYYQTYALYLAEKGFVRPMAWSDIRSLQAAGRELFCASCGFPLPARPVEACPACQSTVGVLDPARLASAIDPHDVAGTVAATESARAEPQGAIAAPATAPGTFAQPAAGRAPEPAAGRAPEPKIPPAIGQHKCHACGGAVDLTRDIHCPHCQAPVLRLDAGDPRSSAAASEAVAAAAAAVRTAEAAVRANAQRQHAAVSRRMLGKADHPMVDFARERGARRLETFELRLAMALVIGALALAVMAWYRQPAERSEWKAQEAPLITYAARFPDEAIECDLHSSVRREVRVRQLVVMPGTPGALPSTVSAMATATYGAMRAAHLRAKALRQEWASSGAFEMLEQQFSHPFASPASVPANFFRRGEALAAVERVAFCLPLREISPPVLAEDGFHIIEVLEAR